MMRDWRDNFGKPVRQLTVRNQSTKDNVGTLPLYTYTTPEPLPRPLDFCTTNEITATHTEPEMQQVSGGACLFEANSAVVVKGDHIRGFPLRGPFFVGSILTDVSDKELNSLSCEIQLFVPSFEDCLLFRLHGRISIHRDDIVTK